VTPAAQHHEQQATRRRRVVISAAKGDGISVADRGPNEAMAATPRAKRSEGDLRRRLIIAAVVVTVLGLLHHLDHVVRGEIVVDEGLPHGWNHSGWPFRDELTVFTASLSVYAILVGGIALTLLRRAWAGYWLAASIVLLAIVVFVHFLGPEAETPRVIWRTYDGGAGPVLALLDLVALLGALIGLAVQAVAVRRRSGRWRDGRSV
jgi:hypothetical protein